MVSLSTAALLLLLCSLCVASHLMHMLYLSALCVALHLLIASLLDPEQC
jgi:hypothetical protein